MTHIKDNYGKDRCQGVTVRSSQDLPSEVQAFLSIYMDVAKRLVREELYESARNGVSEE